MLATGGPTRLVFLSICLSLLLLLTPQNVKTPLDMVRSPSLPYAEVFDMPITMYFMWVFPDYSKPYPETYELATYLLRK